jgi:phosphatidylserine decarboxylase
MVLFLLRTDWYNRTGELFSVSPYMAKRLENLFVLNERVALLGRWKYGFFGMVPVGATNVGSIKINFDTVNSLFHHFFLLAHLFLFFLSQALRTNIRGRRPPPGTYTEGIYSSASTALHGQPLRPAQEMGGFCLGSTIVLVFEAPKTFEFKVQAGQKIKVGQCLGDVVKEKDE